MLILLVAAILLFSACIVHSWLGEVMIVRPLLAALPAAGVFGEGHYARTILRLAWHATSIAWCGIGIAIAVMAVAPASRQWALTLTVFAATFCVTAIAMLVTTRGRHKGWLLFLAVAILLQVATACAFA
ncbi:hypothetical protein [Sphingopyxis sp.]|uniref:hypothetical protein n=1 Tax=Sphingopyxis sp. TaxID=1908224 RepID=UPI003D6D8D2C